MYLTFIVKQVYKYIFQVSVYRTIGTLVNFLTCIVSHVIEVIVHFRCSNACGRSADYTATGENIYLKNKEMQQSLLICHCKQ